MNNDRAKAIQAVLDEPRNGMNYPIRYSRMLPRFIISDGVKELADKADCYWLLDVLATELEPKLLAAINAGDAATVYVSLEVGESGARIEAAQGDGQPLFWSKAIPYTDFPKGDWSLFEVGGFDWDMNSHQAKNVIAILPREH